MNKINLGDKVKDTVTGFEGIVIGRTKWLHGCDRLVVQPPIDKEGKKREAESFDEPQLKVIKRAVVKAEVEKPGKPKTGGFTMKVTQRETPQR